MPTPIPTEITLEQGTLYRIEWCSPNSSFRGTFYGVYTRDERDGLATHHVFWQAARGRYTALRFGKVIAMAIPLTAADMMAHLDLYQRVNIFKYGSTYAGTIVGKGRTRVCVAFRTMGGKDKCQWIPALEVEPA